MTDGPGLVAVEYLLSDWSRGEGRGDRPGFDTAWRAGVEEPVSFDQEGDDARWFSPGKPAASRR